MNNPSAIVDLMLETERIGDHRLSDIMIELGGIAGAIRGCSDTTDAKQNPMLSVSLKTISERVNDVIERLRTMDREQYSNALDARVAATHA